jgi:hypothetical protein
MPNLSVQIGADTSKLVAGINQAKATLQDYIKAQDEASTASEENSNVTKEQVQAYNKVINGLQKVAEGTLSNKQAQRELTNSVKELKEQWAALNNEARSSSFGKSMSETMAAAKAELQEMKNNIASVGDVKPNGSLKKELRLTTNELIQLTAQYRAMSAAEKASAQGQELAQKMQQIRQKAGDLKDMIGDVNTEITAMASDTPNLSAFGELLGVTGDLLSAHASIIAKVTGDDKKLKDAIATVMVVQTTYNAVLKIANAQETFAHSLSKIRTIQERALAASIQIKTAAEGKGVIVTKAATVAQRAFNLVAKANPYVLLATVILGAGAALVAFTSHANEASNKNKQMSDAAERAKAAFEKMHHENETLGNKTGDLVAKYKTLQAQFKSLKTEAEKKKWIKENQSAFNDLGVVVNDVNDAYSVFVKNAPKVIAALKAIARAEAFEDLYKESIKNQAKWENRDKSIKTGDYYKKVSDSEKKPVSAYGGLPKEWRDAGLKPKEDYKSNYDEFDPTIELTQKGINKINKYRRDEAIKTRSKIEKGYEDEVNHYGNLYDKAIDEAAKARDELSKIGGKPKPEGRSGSGGNTVDYKPGSLSDLEAKLNKLQKNYKDGVIKITPENYKKQVDDLEKQIKAKKIELGIADFDDQSLADLEDKLSNLENDYKNGIIKITPEDYKKQVDDLKKEISEKKIALGLEPYVPEGSLEDLDRKINDLEAKYKLAVPDSERRKIQVELNKLTNERRKIEFETDIIIDDDALNIIIGNLENEEHEIRLKPKLEPEAKLPRVKGETPKVAQYHRLEDTIEQISQLYDAHKRVLDVIKPINDAIQEKVKLGVQLNDTEQKTVDWYKEEEKYVKDIEGLYLDAANASRKWSSDIKQRKGSGEFIKREIGFIGDFTSAAKNYGGAWKQMGENWNKMTAFEKTTSVIENTINSIEELINAYESVMDMIKLFGELSELAAAKKVAANTAEMASDEALVASQTANTQVKIANDTAENTSEIGKLGVKEGSAIASATASGAALPFPANIAAIAAGIAAVVAAFAMVFSAFAEGGIVGGGSYIGDSQLVRVNSGEMILNGQQQKRLFKLLNGTDSRNGATVGEGGVVKFKIKGNNLYGVLNNHIAKQNRV